MRKGALGFAAIALLSGNAWADDDSVPNILPPPDHGARTLRGHTYIEPATQDTAFLTSYVGVRQGLAYIEVPSFPVLADTRKDLHVFELNERIDFAIRILPWLGVFMEGDGSIATGLDTDSIVFGNSAYSVGARGGPVVRLYRSRETGSQVTLRGYIGGAYGNALTVPSFLEGVLVRANEEAQTVPTTAQQAGQRATQAVEQLSNALLSETTSSRWGVSAHYAQTIVPMVGLQTSLGYERAHATLDSYDPNLQYTTESRWHDNTIRFGTAVSIDGYHIKVPIAVLLEYALEKTYRTIGEDSSHVPSEHFFGAGLFYSGRTDLQLGFSAFTRRNLKAQDVTTIDGAHIKTDVPNEIYGELVLRYVWN